MRYVSIIEDKPYLLWQQEIQARNIASIGEGGKLSVVVLYDTDEPSLQAKKLDYICEVFFYKNEQGKRGYLPSNKPYGVKRLLQEHPEYGKDLFLIDSDVIFREPVDFSIMNDPKGMYASDCASYLGWDYVTSKYPESMIPGLLSIVGISTERVAEIQNVSGGAQYYFKNITEGFCEKVELHSTTIYEHMCKARDTEGSSIQVWTAEMWAWLWNAATDFNLYTPSELTFCWATDPKSRWDETKILHLAGVTSRDMGLFYKGLYTDYAPWESEDFDYITNENSCAWVYFELMQEYKEFKYVKKQNAD